MMSKQVTDTSCCMQSVVAHGDYLSVERAPPCPLHQESNTPQCGQLVGCCSIRVAPCYQVSQCTLDISGASYYNII